MEKYTIYYKTGEHSPSGETYGLLKKALNLPEDILIQKTRTGKPFIAGGQEFSISHTAGLWAVAAGELPCGLDVQLIDERNWEPIAKRMFAQEDVAYVTAKGKAGFYQLWARYEALAKYTGQGIFASKPVLTDGTKPLSWVSLEDGGVAYVQDLDASFCGDCCESSSDGRGFRENSLGGSGFDGAKYAAAICTRGSVEIEMRRLDE